MKTYTSNLESQNAILKNREGNLIAKVDELKRMLRDLNANFRNSEEENKILRNALEYLKTYIPKESYVKDLALNEISRKEDVIIHKDMKATRLINIIREKNDIINTLVRRQAWRDVGKVAAGTCIRNRAACTKQVRLRSADSDKNWRAKN